MGNIVPDKISVSKWNRIMEDSFQSPSTYLNAAGIRRTCGVKPTRLRYPKKSNFNSAMDSYLRCTDEVRRMNLAAGLPADTGLPTPVSETPSSTPSSSTPSSPSSSNISLSQVSKEAEAPEGMSTTKKVLIGTGVVLVLTAAFFAVRHFKKAGAASGAE